MQGTASSFYMGISCRPAARIISLESSLSVSSNLHSSCKMALSYSQERQDSIGIIHLRKRKKK